MIYKTYRIGDICSMVKGTYPTMNTEPGEYPLVVTAEYRRSASTYQLEGPAVCVPLISSTGHGDAALHRVHYQEGKFALANLLVALIPNDLNLCDARYLYQLLMAKKDQYFVPLMSGTANVSLKIQDIAGVEIPLPSIEEQHHIVARIEELAAKIEEAKGLRRVAVEETERLLVSSITRALKTIRGETREVTVEEIAQSVTDGDHQPPPKADSGIPFIFISNIVGGKIDFSNCKWVPPEYYASIQSSRIPKRGDILYTAVGATYGVPCLVNTDKPFCFQRHISIIKPDRSQILPEYLKWTLSSSDVYEQATKAVTGSAQPTVPLKGIRNLRFTLPTIHEQYRIVAYLDDVEIRVNALNQLQSETSTELDALLPSVLDVAFKGEL